MKKIIRYAVITINSVRKRGIKDTLLFIMGEYWFDIRFQVNTRPCLLEGGNDIIGAHLPYAEPHFGTNWFVLKKVFVDLIRNGLIDPVATHMIDFGCGAGRALMAAHHFGIKKVTGVDFNKMLCLRAEENLRKFSQQNKKYPDLSWEIVHADACSFSIPQDARLFFLFNPFGMPVIETVAQNIFEHARKTNILITVIYVNPVHGVIFERLGFSKSHKSCGEFAIYAGNGMT